MTKYGERIKELRKNKKISQEELANILDVSTSTICKWENYQAEPSLELLVKLSYFFEVSIDYILNYDIKKSSLELFINELEKATREKSFDLEYDDLNIALKKYSNNAVLIYKVLLYLFSYGLEKNNHEYLEKTLECAFKLMDLNHQLVENNISTNEIYEIIAITYSNLGKYDEAIDYLNKLSICIDKDFLLARNYYRKGMYDEALIMTSKNFALFFEMVSNGMLTNINCDIKRNYFKEAIDKIIWLLNFITSLEKGNNSPFNFIKMRLHILQAYCKYKLRDQNYLLNIKQAKEIYNNLDYSSRIAKENVKFYYGEPSTIFFANHHEEITTELKNLITDQEFLDIYNEYKIDK